MEQLVVSDFGALQTKKAGREDSWGFRYRGLIGGLILAPAGVLAVFSPPLLEQSSYLNLLFDLFAWTTFCVGATLRIWSTLYIGCRKGCSLVTEGPYSMCRNPLYFGSLLVAISAGFFLQSVVLTAGVLAVCLWYLFATVPSEERVLRSAYDLKYEEYCRRTPRFCPNISLFETPECVEVKVHGLRIEAKRLLVWAWLPLFCQGLAFLRETAWWPTFFHVP